MKWEISQEDLSGIASDSNGKLTGDECKEGKNDVKTEGKARLPILTATTLVEGEPSGSPPVKVSKRTPKSRMKACTRIIAKAPLKPSIGIGQVIFRKESVNENETRTLKIRLALVLPWAF